MAQVSSDEKLANNAAVPIIFVLKIFFVVGIIILIYYLFLLLLFKESSWIFLKSLLNISLTEQESSSVSLSHWAIILTQLLNIILTGFLFGGIFNVIWDFRNEKRLGGLIKKLITMKAFYYILKKIKWPLGIFLLLLGICIYSSCKSNKNDNKVYVWGGPKNLAFLPIVAQEKGFFSENNIQTKRNDLQTGKMAMDALQSGDINFGILVETNISFSQFGTGKPLKVIAIIQEKHDDAIVYNSTKIKNPRDLIGKKIGISSATTSHSFIIKYLISQGVPIDSCTFINMAPPAIQAALINKTLDAGSIWQPFRYNVFKADSAKVMKEFTSKEAYTGYGLIVVTEEFAKKNKDEIEKFLKSLVMAENYIDKNTAESQKILATQISISLDVLQSIWDEYTVRLNLNPKLMEAFNSDVKWIKKYVPEYKDKPIPNFNNVIQPDFLKDVDKSRVSE